MKQIGRKRNGRVPAALLRAMVLALLVPFPAMAQESLPSVSDYKLPPASSTPRARPQGPIDPDNPVVVPPRNDGRNDGRNDVPAETPAAAARPAPDSSPAASASASPRPAATASARPVQPAARSAASPVASATASPASAVAPAPQPRAAAPVAASDPATTAPIAWNVHSASEVLRAQSPGKWPWLAALAFAIGVVLTLALQKALRGRRALAAEVQRAETDDLPERLAPLAVAPLPPGPEAEAELDLITVMARPEPASAADAAAGGQQGPSPGARPALDVHVNPLDVVLAARRMSATLMNAVLSYELIVSNKGSETIGPVTVGGDMIGAHATLSDRAQLEMPGQAIVPLHRLASLAPGESVTVAGEFKLPLAAITPIRSGNASLFVPLARFRVEASRPGAPPLALNSAFVIGEDQQRPGAALLPFRLDLGPRLYSRIGQRALALSA